MLYKFTLLTGSYPEIHAFHLLTERSNKTQQLTINHSTGCGKMK